MCVMKYPLEIVAFLLIGLSASFCYPDNLTLSIIDSANDAEEDITGPLMGDVRRTSSDLEIGNENGVERWVGLRFEQISISPGSVINSASIKFTADQTDVGTLTIPIFGQLAPNPGEFSDIDPITTRTLTTANVVWEIDPWFPGDSGINTTTSDLTAIVQEIVDQGGWNSGNSMVFILQNDPGDTSERIAVSFDGNPLMAAEFNVDFTPPSTTQATPDSFAVSIGSVSSGGVPELSASDDQYLVLDPTFLTFRYQLVFTVDATSPSSAPSSIEFSYESRAFSFVGTVDQKIELFNYVSGQFETVDTRLASATDSVVSVTPTGDPTRFVQAGTNAMQARISYQNSLPFWVFSTQNLYLPYRVRADQIFWSITP